MDSKDAHPRGDLCSLIARNYSDESASALGIGLAPLAGVQAPRPEFRSDLVAKPITVGATRLIELHDPKKGRTLRFSEAGYSIAYLLNGKRTLVEVSTELFKQRGLRLTVEKLTALVEQLELLGCMICDPNLTVPYNALKTVAIPVLGDGGVDEALATVALGAEAFSDYYTIVPSDEVEPIRALVDEDVDAKVKAMAEAIVKGQASLGQASRARPARPMNPPPVPAPVPGQARSKPRATPAPPLAAKAKAEVLPELPPLPAWPPLEDSMRRERAQARARSLQRQADLAPVQEARHFPVAPASSKMMRKPHSGPHALWLATGFFAAALVWASWALFRLV